MSQNHSILRLTIPATAAITPQTLVDWTGAPATAAGNSAGVAATSANPGDLFPCDVLGTSVVQAGGVIAIGDRLEVGASGAAVKHDAGVPVAVALEAAAAAGDTIEVFLIPN